MWCNVPSCMIGIYQSIRSNLLTNALVTTLDTRQCLGDKSAGAIDSITIVELVGSVDAIDMKQATATLNAPVVGAIERELDFKGD
jgi:hypothetical protein